MGAGASFEGKSSEKNYSGVFRELEQEYVQRTESGLSPDESLGHVKKHLIEKHPEIWEDVKAIVHSNEPVNFSITKSDIFVDMPNHDEEEEKDSVTPLSMKLGRKASTVRIPYSVSVGSSKLLSRSDSAYSEVGQMQQACRKFMERLMLRNSHTYVVAVDGSEASHRCLEVGLILRKGFDRLQVLHFYSSDKTVHLPENLKPAALEASYANELQKCLEPNQYSLQFLERDNMSARTAIFTYINNYNAASLDSSDGPNDLDLGPSFLLVGVLGSEGPDDNPKILGSLTDLALRCITIPTIVVKKSPSMSKKERTFVLCTDSSDRAFNAYSIIQTVARARDKLVLLYISGAAGALEEDTEDGEVIDEKGAQLRLRYELDMDDRGTTNGEFVVIQRELGKTVPEMIIEQCIDRDADFVVLAPHPKNRISSVTEAIIRDGSFNLIICKN